MRLCDVNVKRLAAGSGGLFCNGFFIWGDEGGRKEIGGGREREMPVSEAFRCHGANLLPFTKFIGKGLFIK